MTQDGTLAQAIKSGDFLVTAELLPRATAQSSAVKSVADALKDGLVAVNVADNPFGPVMSSLAGSAALIQSGVEPVFQLVTRDRNRIALQSDLLGAWVLGIKNVLALTGDLPALGDHPGAMGVFDLDSVTLLRAVTSLNEGFDMAGNELKGKPAFFPGAVVKVESNTEASTELQIAKMQKKVAAGARFVQTQAVYDANSFEKFMKRVEGLKVPVMAGIIPLKNAGMAKYMNASVAGVNVPEALIEKMSSVVKEDRAKTGIQIAADLIKQIKPMCQGVHIMAIGWEKRVPEIIAEAGL